MWTCGEHVGCRGISGDSEPTSDGALCDGVVAAPGGRAYTVCMTSGGDERGGERAAQRTSGRVLDAREIMPWETPGERAYMPGPERTGYGDTCIQTRAGECSL